MDRIEAIGASIHQSILAERRAGSVEAQARAYCDERDITDAEIYNDVLLKLKVIELRRRVQPLVDMRTRITLACAMPTYRFIDGRIEAEPREPTPTERKLDEMIQQAIIDAARDLGLPVAGEGA